MAFTENFAPFFADFGIDATVGGAAVVGIFDRQYLTEMGFVAGSSPVLLCISAEVSSAGEGTAVTIGAASYTVTVPEPDGTGLTLLRLQEA